MDLNTSMFSILGPVDGTVLIMSQVTALVLVAVIVVVVALLIGLLLGLLIGRSRTPKAADPVSAAAPTAASQSTDEDEIVAVIAATILAMESARTGTQLILRGITHTGTEGTPWSAAGRKNLMK